MDKTARNLWVAFLEEAKANRMYTAFGIRAMEENHPEIAQLFLEVAGAETAHAISHLKVVGQVKSTLEISVSWSSRSSLKPAGFFPR